VSEDGSTTEQPLLRVVSPNATPEEIAALVAVLASLNTGVTTPPERRKPEWQAHHRKVRAALPHGPGGWRSSGLPR
jgi:acyl-CoA carboxylase epsilon subunit